MLMTLMAALVLQTVPEPAAEDLCTHDREAILALAPTAFDLDMEGGWRPLADRPECLGVAAGLLAAYREAHWGELDPDELHRNYWHEGQLRAARGETEPAIRLLLAGTNPGMTGDGRADYALATVAFLNGDRPALEAARARLAATPHPEGFEQAAVRFEQTYGYPLVWPMNLDVVDGLIACFGRPYSEAYGDCRDGVPTKEPEQTDGM